MTCETLPGVHAIRRKCIQTQPQGWRYCDIEMEYFGDNREHDKLGNFIHLHGWSDMRAEACKLGTLCKS